MLTYVSLEVHDLPAQLYADDLHFVEPIYSDINHQLTELVLRSIENHRQKR
jgi:hypothetical protein